jgi:hypothetical protein
MGAAGLLTQQTAQPAYPGTEEAAESGTASLKGSRLVSRRLLINYLAFFGLMTEFINALSYLLKTAI